MWISSLYWNGMLCFYKSFLCGSACFNLVRRAKAATNMYFFNSEMKLLSSVQLRSVSIKYNMIWPRCFILFRHKWSDSRYQRCNWDVSPFLAPVNSWLHWESCLLSEFKLGTVLINTKSSKWEIPVPICHDYLFSQLTLQTNWVSGVGFPVVSSRDWNLFKMTSWYFSLISLLRLFHNNKKICLDLSYRIKQLWYALLHPTLYFPTWVEYKLTSVVVIFSLSF